MVASAAQRSCPIIGRRFATHQTLLTVSRAIPTKLPVRMSRSFPVKLERNPISASDLNTMDRRIIRVDMTPTQAGITAALRRAFEAAASDPCDRDFADLLRHLN